MYRIPHEVLSRRLEKKHVSDIYIQIIEDIYEGVKTSVKTFRGDTKEFPMHIGLHQGSALSPFPFACVMNEFTRGIQEKLPQCMFCADDIVLIDETRVGVKSSLEQ